MNQLTDIAAKIEALPTYREMSVEIDEAGWRIRKTVNTSDLKALAAEVKRLTDENARLREGLTDANTVFDRVRHYVDDDDLLTVKNRIGKVLAELGGEEEEK